MEKTQFDLTFWFKILFIAIVIIGYFSLNLMEPIIVSSVAASTNKAVEIGGIDKIGFIAVESRSIINKDGGSWVYLVNGNLVKKTPVKVGTLNGKYAEIVSGLLLKDSYVLNLPEKDAEDTTFPVDWRFDIEVILIE